MWINTDFIITGEVWKNIIHCFQLLIESKFDDEELLARVLFSYILKD